MKHSKLSEQVETSVTDSKFISSQDKQLIEICYPAIIQSGGNYSLKFSAQSDKNNLSFLGTIVCMLGYRYKNYCSNIVRTLMVEPTEKMQENYKYLLTLEEMLAEEIKDGVKLNEVYDKIKEKCASERPDLADKLTANMGFLTGIEFREPNYLISPKCQSVVKSGMIFNVSIGFSDLTNPDAKEDEAKKYALFLGDTIQVNKDEAATILTQSKKKIENIAIFVKDEDDESDKDQEENDKQKKAKDNANEILTRGTRGALLSNKTRADHNQEQVRKEHQKELSKRLNEEAKERILSKKGSVVTEKIRKVVTAYRNASQLPYKQSEIKELKIYVDKAHETVLLPIFGVPTPFHISTIKNLSSSVEGDYTYLRINFFNPGVSVNKIGGAVASNNEGTYRDHDCVFMKEITYRATNIKESGEISPPSTNLGKMIADDREQVVVGNAINCCCCCCCCLFRSRIQVHQGHAERV